MEEVPVLINLAFALNALVDQGLSIPLEEVKMLCKEERIIGELVQRFPLEKTGLDWSLLKRGTRARLSHVFHDLAVSMAEQEKFGIRNNGLCLLIAYTQEQVKRELAKYFKVKIL